MGIAHHLREIGRGRDGARALTRAQAHDLMGQVLDGHATDLEIGAFCIAMRVKGETPEEMLGFLDAVHARLPAWTTPVPTVVLPSYNGARRLPVLTPLLAALLAREGLAVLLHGSPSESGRTDSASVLAAMGVPALSAPRALAAGEVTYLPTAALHAGLDRLLQVRRTIGLRNPAHSLVKLLSPLQGPVVLVSSHTHPEYALSMAETLRPLTQERDVRALLLRGTEGEPVADPRRQPRLDAFARGEAHTLVSAQEGSLTHVPQLPDHLDAAATADWTRAVLAAAQPTPAPLNTQVQAILRAFTL